MDCICWQEDHLITLDKQGMYTDFVTDGNAMRMDIHKVTKHKMFEYLRQII